MPQTHWPDCYTFHHQCAVTEVNRLRALLVQAQAETEQANRVQAYTSAEWKKCHDELLELRRRLGEAGA
jgi:hypothetical protein